MFSSLRSRFSLTFALLIAIVLCMAAGMMFFVVRNLPVRTTNIRLQELSRIIVSQEELTELSPRRQAEALKRFAEQNDVRILIVDRSGEVFFDTAPENTPELDSIPIPNPSRRSNNAFQNGSFRDNNRRIWQFTLRPLNHQRLLVLASPQPRIQTLDILADDLLPPLLWVTGFTLLLAILLAGLTARWVSQPLGQIVDATRHVPGGKVMQIKESGPEEVRQLSRAFNEMNAQVAAGKRSQQDFVANVSHELKTPLTAIQGFAQAIGDGTAGSEQEIHQAADVIYNEAGRMHRLVLDLLELARIEGGTAAFDQNQVDIAALLGNLVLKFTPIAQKNEIVLLQDIQKMPDITGDGDKLMQVFNNLLDNAIKHSPPGSQVNIKTARLQDSVEIHFIDSGPGIPPEEQTRIFERFYQLDKARTHNKDSGFGLGLAIAQEIVHAHGGDLRVVNQAGRGSNFVVKLPF